MLGDLGGSSYKLQLDIRLGRHLSLCSPSLGTQHFHIPSLFLPPSLPHPTATNVPGILDLAIFKTVNSEGTSLLSQLSRTWANHALPPPPPTPNLLCLADLREIAAILGESGRNMEKETGDPLAGADQQNRQLWLENPVSE